MPEGHYGAGFVMVEDKEGRPRGYFLTSDRYDDKKKPLATALLAAFFPELGIETWQRLKSYGEVEMLVSRADMDKYGAVADEIGRASGRERVGQYGMITVGPRP